MSNDTTARKWSDIRNIEVSIPSEGRSVGKIVDFYVKTDTNAVDSFCVRTRLQGDWALPVASIKSIDKKTVNIPSEQMLTKALPPLTRGQDLHGWKIVDESGKEAGTIGEIWLAVESPAALRIADFERSAANGHQARKFTADEVVRYEAGTIVIYNKTARRLQR